MIKESYLKTLVGTFLIAFSLNATAILADSDEEHIPVGTRSMILSERALLQEEQAQYAEKYPDEEALLADELIDPQWIETISLELEDRFVSKGDYSSSHPSAYHRPLVVSPLGDNVELEDGSIWAVKYEDRHKTLDWMTGDSIIVTPNHTWFSSYNYRLINQKTGVVVTVNLFKGPIYNGKFTHWITSINYSNLEVCLEDGSIWKLSFWDRGTLKKWLINDTIIIGINDGWFSGSNPNILINVNVDNFSKANCTSPASSR